LSCHYLGGHTQGTVILREPDLDATLAYDPPDPALLEGWCLDCHDSDGASAWEGGLQPFTDGRIPPNVKGLPGSLWADSAHSTIPYASNSNTPVSCAGDGQTGGCHGNAHGSDNVKLLSAEAGVSIHDFCFNCHTNSLITNLAISGGGLADDIEQAFAFSAANVHDLDASFTMGGNSYTLECTTCHNPHVATGQYWEAHLDRSPVTRPDFSDPANNPRAMGTTLWGGQSGEKLNDYAGSGMYQTPQGDLFTGAELPDYNTFCEDCHEAMPDPSAEAGAHGQLQFASDPHGRHSANVPDGGAVCPNWSNCGKGIKWSGDECVGTDPECWPVLPRGMGEQSWSKSPYYQEERISGVNFVLSCTDCHEAHGSTIQSLIRLNPNEGTGSTNWLTMCNNCHSFYSDFHAGMSCGNASCHGANAENERMWYTGTDTLHRMGQRYGDGSVRAFGYDLVLDMRFENDLKDSSTWRLDGTWSLNRPDSSQHSWCASDPNGTGSFVSGRFGNAIQIDNQPVEVGTEDCDWSTAENSYSDTREDNGLGHTHPGHGTWKYTEMKYALTLEAWVQPTDANNERKIMAKHTYGTGGYALVLNQFDGTLRVGLLANVNGGSGSGDCGGLRGAYSSTRVPLNEWTHVAATYDVAGPDRDDADGSVGRIRIYVNGEDVTTSSADVSSCYAQPGTGEDAMFPNSDHNYGDPASWWGSALSVGGLNWSDTNANFVGRLDEVKVWNVTQDATYFATADSQSPPRIDRLELITADQLLVTFSEGVFGSGPGAALLAGDLDLSCSGKTIVNMSHTGGEATAILTWDAPLAPSEVATCTISVASGLVWDEHGLLPAIAVAEAVPVDLGHFPSIASVEGLVGGSRLKVSFQSQVYTNMGETGALQPDDFALTAGSNIDTVQHVAGSAVAFITLDAPLGPGEVGTATLAAEYGSIFGPGPIHLPVGTDTALVTAQNAPAISRVEGAAGYGQVFVSFTEGVYTGSGQSGGLVATDFVDTSGAWDVIGVQHVAGQSGAILTLSSVLDPGDIGLAAIGAAGDEIFSSIDNPAETTAVILTGSDCPVWGTSFPIEDLPQASATISDEHGLLTGTVTNPAVVFPDPLDNDWFNGDDEQATSVGIASNNACLNSPRAITIEARVRPTEVDKGVGINTFNRIFERRRTVLVTILNTDYRGDDVPERADKSSIEVKYRVDVASRHACPHPQWSSDPYVGTDVRMHQISSDIDQWPIVNGHWYRVKVVFNSDKSDVPLSNGTPVDVFLDDQGADGLNAVNPTPGEPELNPDYEQWAGYVNATKTINGSSSCRWGSLPGDFIEFRSDTSHIGANWSNAAQHFEGQIDWVTWQPIADYTGVDDPPR
jgi:hypothetical protein